MRWAVLIVAVALISGCASYQPLGVLYTEGKVGVQENGGATPKVGRACMTSILGLVATGDASIEAAKAAGNIQEVAVIDYEVKNILGVYGQYCLVVKGR